MHRNLLLHPLKYRRTPAPGTSGGSTLTTGGFRSSPRRWPETQPARPGLSLRHHRDKTLELRPKTDPCAAAGAQRDDGRPRKRQIGAGAAGFASSALSDVSEITSLI